MSLVMHVMKKRLFFHTKLLGGIDRVWVYPEITIPSGSEIVFSAFFNS